VLPGVIGSKKSKSTSRALLGENALKTLSHALGHPVYWAGPRPATRYEVTQTKDGRVYVRYLPVGVEAGTKSPYLTVGTYPVRNALAVTQAAAKRSGAVALPVGNGGAGFYDKSRPTSVFFAFPGFTYQIEVYDPDAAEALRLFRSGIVAPVPGSETSATKVATTPSGRSTVALLTLHGLRTVARALHRPLYWVGPRPGVQYEVTQSAGGAQMYVRYLPAGVPAGSKERVVTVGTYLVRDAFSVTQAASRGSGAKSISFPGGVAYTTSAKPTSVFLAIRGSRYQIELFDPKAGEAKALAAAGAVAPVG